MVSTLTHALRGDFDAWSWGVSVAIWVAGVLLVTGSWPAVLLLSPCLIPLLLQPDKALPIRAYDILPASIAGPLEFLTSPTVAVIILTFLVAHLIKKLLLSKSCLKYDVKPIDQELKIVGKVNEPSLEQIPQLVEEMRASFNSGVSRPLAKRIEQLKQLRKFFTENEEQIIKALQSDLGRPLFEATYYDLLLPISEIDAAIHNLASWAQPKPVGFNLLTFPSQQYIIDEPLGVALVISTWNYPLLLALTPALGAISAGNVVVLKPCNVSPATSRLMAELLPKYMDPQILSVVGANMDGDRTCTAKLLEQKFDVIFFTGSPSVGRVIMEGAAKYLTPVILELGGKNPVLVDRNANIDLAAKRTVWGRMMNCGQQCISPDYVLCHKDVIDEFCTRSAYWAKTLYGADPKNNGNFGRVVGEKQTERLIGVLKNHGGQVVCGGNYDAKARFIEPTVLRVDKHSPAMVEETFGPILLVTPVANVDEAIAYVNSKPKPLSLYLFSNDERFQRKVINNTSSGGVTVNATLFHVGHTGLPFGGVGDSGIGAYHGKASFDVFSHKKPVLIKAILPDFGLLSDPFFLYPEWTPLKLRILRVLMKFV